MNITYTFPPTFAVPELRGITAVGGQWTTTMINGKRTPTVTFASPKLAGKKTLVAIIAGKQELEKLWAAESARRTQASTAAAAAEAIHRSTPRGQRDALVRAESETYSPDAFPGSTQWRANKAAADALAAFDLAHPELVAELKAERAESAMKRYASLSDFVKLGS